MIHDNNNGGRPSLSQFYKVREHDREHKVCPIISTPSQVVPCQAMGCQLWISSFTTEGLRAYGCAYELQPNINIDGRFNV